MTTLTDTSPLAVELRGAVNRYAELARTADGTQRLSGSAWTVWESVAHVATVAPRYSKFPHGTQKLAETPAVLPALNAAEIQELNQRSVGELLGLLDQAVEAVISQVEAYGDASPAYRFHGGEMVGADVALGILLGELLVHGWDLATTMRRSWPVTREQVSLIWSGVEPILPGWVDPDRSAGHQAAYQVHLGDSRQHILCFTNGRLTTELPADRRIDCHIGGSPQAILLILYRRLSPWQAAVTGRVAAWGKRPWLAFSVADRFYLP
jgi:Mycothiol maleylpyruvate isomerase N-terminal domain